MELRHLRYFLAVGEALNFTKAAVQLRVAQPALSRQVQDLEDEIGVDLMKRSPRGVTLTAEGKLFLEEVRELLKRADESVEKVRALARGEYGELQSAIRWQIPALGNRTRKARLDKLRKVAKFRLMRKGANAEDRSRLLQGR